MTDFHEEQRLRPPRFRWLVAFPPSLLTALAAAQIWLGRPLGAHSLRNGELVSLAMFLWVVYVWLSRVQLVTDVDAQGVSIRLRGLSRHHRIPVAKIKAAALATFNPEQDFGGYGIRTVARGRAYVANTRRGARLELEGGGFATIGSKRPEELVRAIERARRNQPSR